MTTESAFPLALALTAWRPSKQYCWRREWLRLPQSESGSLWTCIVIKALNQLEESALKLIRRNHVAPENK
jgi:hypothetical protein